MLYQVIMIGTITYFFFGLGFNPRSLRNVLEHELRANLDNMLRRFGPSPSKFVKEDLKRNKTEYKMYCFFLNAVGTRLFGSGA